MSTTMRPALSASAYQIRDVENIHSPGLVVFRELLEHNLAEMIRVAGGPARLRPHCKTHKMPAVIRRMRELGMTRHKCATLAEAEMLCDAGVDDILIAYQLVGPNIGRLVALMDKFPDRKFTALIDHPRPLEQLSQAVDGSHRNLHVLLDVDSGMGRTGVPADDSAMQLYEMICSTPGIQPAGLHWYDGHHRQSDPSERQMAIQAAWQPLVQLRDRLLLDGFPVPRIVVAGTGSFPILAEMGEPNLELTPGTTTLYDIGYHENFPDLNLQPAAAIVTRVVSSNRAGQLTLDCGHKSISPDQPAGQRARFPALPDAVEIHHTEEHLVIRTSRAPEYQPGDSLIALPRHICPTVALHAAATVVAGGQIVDTWEVVARDRQLTI